MVWQTGMDVAGLEGRNALTVELNARSRIGVGLQVGQAKDLGAAGTRGYSIDTGRSQAFLLLGGGFRDGGGQCRGFDGS